MNLSIFGLGYVGVVSVACLAARGHIITGVDVNEEKVRLVDAGLSPITEQDVPELLARAHKDKLICATTDAHAAILATDMAIICIGTPSMENGSLDIRHIESVASSIGLALAQKKGKTIIVLRSTVLPGTTQDTFIPLLEKTSGKKNNQDFFTVYHPEFLREGSAVADFNSPPKIIVGTAHQESGMLVLELYNGISAPQFVTDFPTAEMVKYADNAFHAVKITFANEIGLLCKSFGVSAHQVMDIFRQDKKLNISGTYLSPGFAFGGSCLPKDLRALDYAARNARVEVPMLNSVLESNRAQIRGAVELIMETGKKKIGIAGISFKAGTDDVRESPMLEVAGILLEKKCEVRIFEPLIDPDKLLGVNREYLEKRLPGFKRMLAGSLDELIDKSELVIIGNRNPLFAGITGKISGAKQVLDCAGFERMTDETRRYTGICW